MNEAKVALHRMLGLFIRYPYLEISVRERKMKMKKKSSKNSGNIMCIENFWRIRWSTSYILVLFATLAGSFEEKKNIVLIIRLVIMLLIICIFARKSKLLNQHNTSAGRGSRSLYLALYYFPLIFSLIILLLSVFGILGPFSMSSFSLILWGLVFSVDFCFVLYRWTYRVLPNIFISLAALIFYTIFATFPHGENNILNLTFLDKDRADVFLSDGFTKILGFGIIGTIASTFISKAFEDVWRGFGRNGTGDYAKIDLRFKQQRRKLLSYIGGSSKNNVRINRKWFVFISFAVIIIVEAVLILFLKQGDVRRIILIGYSVGVACAIMGTILHVFITDENLLYAEYSYLYDRRIQAIECLKQELMRTPCEQLGWEWSCYCQVFVNLYCSRNPIFFVNNSLHEVGPTIRYFLELSDERVCPTRVLVELVHCHAEQFPLYCGNEAILEKDYLEIQFANFVDVYVDILGARSPGEPIDFTKDTMALCVIKKMFDMYFTIIENHYNVFSRVSVQGVNFRDAVNLIRLDYFRQLISDRSEIKCKMCHWCQKIKQPKGFSAFHDEERAILAESMRKQFPQKIRELMEARWGIEKLIPTIGKSLDDCFGEMEINYHDNWVEEACRYGIDDIEYWDNGIFYSNN